jgi:hypothetical protein
MVSDSLMYSPRVCAISHSLPAARPFTLLQLSSAKLVLLLIGTRFPELFELLRGQRVLRSAQVLLNLNESIIPLGVVGLILQFHLLARIEICHECLVRIHLVT